MNHPLRTSRLHRLAQRLRNRLQDAVQAFRNLCRALVEYPPFHVALVVMVGALYVVGVEVGIIR